MGSFDFNKSDGVNHNMQTKLKKIAFIFPGQGAQYPTMGKDFLQNFKIAKQTFEEADDLLQLSLSKIIFNGPEELLTQTKNSQLAIYVTSTAIVRTILELFTLKPSICAGLSLGEYTALTASEHLNFSDTLSLVKHRAHFMNDTCEEIKGTMAVVLGLTVNDMERIVSQVNLPNDLWIANFNCPGQIVLSGTTKGIEEGSKAALAGGAKRVLPLQVHGPFHSGLMKKAEDKLSPFIENCSLKSGAAKLVMNVPGDFVFETEKIKKNLIQQVTHSVRWEQGIKKIEEEGVDLYIECGPGKTLSGMNRKIGVNAPTIAIDKIEDLTQIELLIKEGKL
ncbi:MAG: ACP S-malonyltransferase [Parachlamydiaceae bacterium]|nr:ACP S-malonyltransferase [Parachlamydiaceae bacterium]